MRQVITPLLFMGGLLLCTSYPVAGLSLLTLTLATDKACAYLSR